ncbi:MAG: OsmC family protein [Anaerolineales bacterium]
MSEKDPRRRVVVRWLGEYRTDVQVRGRHHIQGDEVPEYGGQDTGPMPTELLLAAVGSCMCLAVAHVARKRRITLTQIEVDVGAEKDMQEFRFHDIFVHIKADLPQESLAPLVEQASRYCFVSNTLRAGCTIHYSSAALVTTPA